jgi:ketosteroid isomerase-like protein
MPVDIVSALQQRWILAFKQRDIEGLVALYSEQSCLFIRTYFNALPPVRLRAEFGEKKRWNGFPSFFGSS